MVKKLEDHKEERARKSADFKIKKRELDEVRIHVAATKEMLRMRRGLNHTTRLEMLEEITEILDDQQKDIQEMFDFGHFASARTSGNIQEEIQILRSELDTTEAELQEIEETTGNLREEAKEL